MNVKDLIPWNRENSRVPAAYRESDPFMTLQREVNRLFDDVWRGLDMPSFGRLPSLSANTRAGWSAGWPSVEVSETDKEIRVTAELPGLEDKDVEVLLDDDVLTVRGEKKSETEDKERQFSERFYGRFERRIALGGDVEEDKVQASFKNGVLTVILPKAEQAQSTAKRIAINRG
jgi:HSP20 family protein